MLKPRFFIDRFVTPFESYYGLHCTKAVTAIRNAKTLVLTSNSLTGQPHFDKFISYLQSDDSLIITSPFAAEPIKQEIFNVLKQVEEFQPDVIIAVGGGSIIDGAKMIIFFYEHGNMSHEDYERSFPADLLNKIDFYAIPTTCGTGSEVSSSAIMKDKGKKRAIVTHDFLPKAFFLDPGFLTALPESIKIETATDAMTHAIEGYVSTINNPVMNVFATNAISLIRANLLPSLEDPADTDALLNLQMAATFAGYVQNHCLVGLCHSISHAIGKFGISHGNLNLNLINHVIEYNSTDDGTRKKYRKLFTASGFGSTGEARQFFESLQKHLKRKEPSPAMVNDMTHDDLIAEILGDKLTEINPVTPDADAIKNIIRNAYEN